MVMHNPLKIYICVHATLYNICLSAAQTYITEGRHRFISLLIFMWLSSIKLLSQQAERYDRLHRRPLLRFLGRRVWASSSQPSSKHIPSFCRWKGVSWSFSFVLRLDIDCGRHVGGPAPHWEEQAWDNHPLLRRCRFHSVQRRRIPSSMCRCGS